MIYEKFQDIQLSRLGMGNMRLPSVDPNNPNAAIDWKKAEEILDYAMSHGINYYDTAYVYNNGESEKCVGAALSKYPRDSYYLATKFYIEATPDYEAVFEEQLKRLRTDHIDFYLIHCLTDGNFEKYLNSGCIAYFEEQKRKGRITYFGFSSHASPETLLKMAEYRKWDFVQIQMNYLDWEFATAKEEYEILASRNIPIMVMESVRGGKLADLGETLNQKMKKKQPDWSITSWALRWLKAKEGVQLMLSGMSSMEQIEDNVSVFETEDALNEEQIAFVKDMAHALKASLTVPCTACRYCCSACPKELDIPGMLKIYNEYKYGGWWNGKELDGIEEKKLPSECIGCKKCMKHCPQGIAIPDYMKKLACLKETGKEE